jgi:hypothetical protein
MIYELRITKDKEYQEIMYLVFHQRELKVYASKKQGLEDITNTFKTGMKWNLQSGGRIDVKGIDNDECSKITNEIMRMQGKNRY